MGNVIVVPSAGHLNGLVDFDCPFRVMEGGAIRVEDGVYAPDYVYSEYPGVVIEDGGWEALAGYTGQYGYDGPVMHVAETLSGRLAQDIMSDVGGVYVVVEVHATELDPEDHYGDSPAGWAVIRMVP